MAFRDRRSNRCGVLKSSDDVPFSEAFGTVGGGKNY